MSHSVIPPSSAHIWGASDGCTGWVPMSQQYPETEDSQPAIEGTASHEIAAELLNARSRALMGGLTRDHFVGKPASNGVIYTGEMFDAAEIYANDVIDLMRERAVFGGDHLGIEQRIESKRVHDLSFGTIDCFLYDQKTGDLYLWDYKYGYEIVEAFENWQLINYAAGILDMLELNGLHTQYIKIHFRIAQPRAFHRDGMIRNWTLPATDLRGYINTLHTNAHVALSSSDAMCQSGSHCKHCTARHACDAALSAGIRLYEVAAKPVPIVLTPKALGVQYAIVKRALKQLEYLQSGFEEQVKSSIRSGVNIPGWIVEESVGRERWTKPIPEIITLGSMLNVDLKKPDEAITPNQARKLGIDDDVITAYSEKPRTGLKVVSDNGNKAQQVFNHE